MTEDLHNKYHRSTSEYDILVIHIGVIETTCASILTKIKLSSK